MTKLVGLSLVDASTQQMGAFDRLVLPSGKTVGEVTNVELARELIASGVSGVSHENGRIDNVKAYSDFLDRMAKAAADERIAEWREMLKRSAS